MRTNNFLTTKLGIPWGLPREPARGTSHWRAPMIFRNSHPKYTISKPYENQQLPYQQWSMLGEVDMIA